MEDYSLCIIKAQKLINRIHEEATNKNFETALDYAYGLEQLAKMLEDSLRILKG